MPDAASVTVSPPLHHPLPLCHAASHLKKQKEEKKNKKKNKKKRKSSEGSVQTALKEIGL